MIVLQKHLTIREAKNEIKKLENELELYLEQKYLNFIKTQPQSSRYEDDIVQSSHAKDKYLHYKIKDEKVDSKIFDIQESINSWERYIIKERRRLNEIDSIKAKVYELREDEEFIRTHGRKRTWLEISELSGFSKRQAQRVYNEIINGII